MIQQLPRGSRKQRPNKHSVLFTVQQHRVHEVDKFLWLYVDSDANMFCMSVKLKLVNNGTTWLYQVILLLLWAITSPWCHGKLELSSSEGCTPLQGSCTSLEQFWEWPVSQHTHADAYKDTHGCCQIMIGDVLWYIWSVFIFVKVTGVYGLENIIWYVWSWRDQNFSKIFIYSTNECVFINKLICRETVRVSLQKSPQSKQLPLKVLYVTTVHQCRQNPLEEISGISLAHARARTHTASHKHI